MPQFQVDDDVAELVERLAKEKPFEQLSFNDALRRIFAKQLQKRTSPDESFADLDAMIAIEIAKRRAEPKKTPTPSATAWISEVPELRSKRGLNTWQAICAHLKIDTAGDSARRKLRNWVKVNRPMWPEVPTLEGDA